MLTSRFIKVLLLCASLSLFIAGCVIKHDRGLHKGHYKQMEKTKKKK